MLTAGRREARDMRVVAGLLLAAFAAAVTAVMADQLSLWGWPDVIIPLPEALVWAAAVLAGAVVLLRAHVAALVVAAVLFGLLPATGAALAVAAHAIGRRGPRPLIAAAVLPAAAVMATQPVSRWDYVLVVIAVATVLAVGLPGLVGMTQAQQARLAADRAELARLQERGRIAGDMHDHLGHRLSLIAMYSGALEVAAKDPRLHDAAHQVRTTARTALDELRHTLGVLGEPTAIERTEVGAGTRADVDHLVAESQAGGVPVTLDWRGPDPQSLDVRQALHRVVREAMTNAHKHAPGAPVAITVDHTADHVTVDVRNGPARTAERLPGTGRGLLGLRERVDLLGGTLSAGPTPDGGFAVTATLPLAAARPRQRPALVSGLLLCTGLVAVSAMLLLTIALLPPFEHSDDDHPLDAMTPGMSREDVEQVWGPNVPTAEIASYDVEPDRPSGSTCTYVPADDPPDADTAAVFRFCFDDTGLVDKTWYEIEVP